MAKPKIIHMLYKEHDSNGLPKKMETGYYFQLTMATPMLSMNWTFYLLANPLTNMDQKNCTRTLYFSCSPCAPERGAQLYNVFK
jgi:hypothetical protein